MQVLLFGNFWNFFFWIFQSLVEFKDAEPVDMQGQLYAKPTAEQGWTWSSSEAGEGKRRKGEIRVESGDVVLGVALPLCFWMPWSGSLLVGFVLPSSVDQGGWTGSVLHNVWNDHKRHPKWFQVFPGHGANNVESRDEKVTLLSSFGHLFLFIPFKEKVSGQGWDCSVTLADPPLFPRSQKDISSIWKNLMMFSLCFLFVAVTTLWKWYWVSTYGPDVQFFK